MYLLPLSGGIHSSFLLLITRSQNRCCFRSHSAFPSLRASDSPGDLPVAFIEACKSDNTSIVVDTLNVWHERLLEFDYQPLSECRIVAYYAVSPSLAGSKPSRTLRECFVICLEPAREYRLEWWSRDRSEQCCNRNPGIPQWHEFLTKESASDMEQHSITAEKLHALLASDQEVLLFDVRRPDLLAYPEMIPKAERIAPNEALARPTLIPKDKDAVVCCTCPSDKTSRMVLCRAFTPGFFRIKFLKGGLAA